MNYVEKNGHAIIPQGWQSDAGAYWLWYPEDTKYWDDYAIYFSEMGNYNVSVYDGTAKSFSTRYSNHPFGPGGMPPWHVQIEIPRGLTPEETKAWLVAFRATIT